MNKSDKLLKAVLNRVSTRIGQKIVSRVIELGEEVKEFPRNIQNEWELLKKDIKEESEKLNKEQCKNKTEENYSNTKDLTNTTQETIDRLRSKVMEIGRKIEARN